MFTKEQLETNLNNHPLIKTRLETLRLAEEINTKFKNPHIVGGYLRNIILNTIPNDCDVSFQGYMFNQPGILEAVQEAEGKLGIDHYPDWEFENISATGYSGDLYEDLVGKYSFHTDYLTLVIMNSKGKLSIGEQEKTLYDFNHQIYDLRFKGVEMWAIHRGNGRSFASCLTGDLTRGLYLCHSLDLTPSPIVTFLWSNYDSIFNKLSPEDQKGRIVYWQKKTKGNPDYQKILDAFGITSLKTD